MNINQSNMVLSVSIDAMIARLAQQWKSAPVLNMAEQIKRYEKDELKEAMEEVMSQEQARKAYMKRQGLVEPVFGCLRGRQGLNKFHRMELAKVRLEFASHAIAYNRKRAFKVFGMTAKWVRNLARRGFFSSGYLWLFSCLESKLPLGITSGCKTYVHFRNPLKSRAWKCGFWGFATTCSVWG
jgi:hypothetical protein